MNSYKPLLHSAILLGSLGIAAVLLGTPSCKAQEVNPDHFTETGVQDVYKNAYAAPAKSAASFTLKKEINSRNPQGVLVADSKKHARAPKRIVAELRQ